MKRLIAMLFLPVLVACDDTSSDVLECRQPHPMIKAFDCSDPSAPARLPYKLEDGRTEVMNSRVQAACNEGICESLDADVFRTTGSHAGTIQQRDRLKVTHNRDYYIGNASDGRIVTYRRGTGPEYGGSVVNARKLKGVDVTASRIPDKVLNAKPNEKFIYSDDNPAYIDGKVWNVQCQNSTCFLGNVNDQVSNRDLVKFIPFDIPKFGTEGSCSDLFCANEYTYDNPYRTIGLNPETFLANGIEGIYARGYQPVAQQMTTVPTSIDPEFIHSERNPAMQRNGKFLVKCDHINETCRLGPDYGKHLIIDLRNLPKYLPAIDPADSKINCFNITCTQDGTVVGYHPQHFGPELTEEEMRNCIKFQERKSHRFYDGGNPKPAGWYDEWRKDCYWRNVSGYNFEAKNETPGSGKLDSDNQSMFGAPIITPEEPLSQEPSDACVDAWAAAHRKEVGEEAMIHWSMLEEWKEWCEAGKTP